MKLQQIKHLLLALICAIAMGAGIRTAKADCCIVLPSYPSNVLSIFITDYVSPDTLFDFTITNGTLIPPGTYGGWCIDANDTIDPRQGNTVNGTVYTGELLSTCDTNELAQIPNHGGNPPVGPPPITSVATWHELNYLINHRPTNDYWDVQVAINSIIGGPPVYNGDGNPADDAYPTINTNVVQTLVSNTMANAASWHAQCGDKVAIVYVVNPPTANTLEQLVILEVPCCSISFTTVPTNMDLGCNPATIPVCQSPVNTNLVNAVSCCGNPVTITCSSSDSVLNCQTFRTFVYTATDGYGNTATAMYTVSWTTDATGPTITTCATNITVTQEQGVPAPNTNLITATSPCGGTPVITWGGDVTNGNCPTVITRTYIATDSCLKTATCEQTITVVGAGQIGNFVWWDQNGNGCQDASEPGIPNVSVALYEGCGISGSPIATTTTGSNGYYLFSGLCLGTYTVSFTTPAGYTHTIPNAGCVNSNLPPYENQLDSKCSCGNASPCGVCVTLTGTEPTNLNIDCGYVKTLTISCAGGTGQAGTPYSSSLVASNGCEPYTFSIISGSLPPGLTLNTSTGAITGTPTNAGMFNYVAQVTDACGNTANTSNDSCGITITTSCSCTPQSIQYNFNGTQIIFQPTSGGTYIWFTSDGTVQNLPSNEKVVMHITDQMITIPKTPPMTSSISFPVPDSYITFDPTVKTASVTFDTVSNVWRMTFPPSGLAGNIMYGAVAFKVPTNGLPGGIQNVLWTGQFITATTGLKVQWQWHAANYSNFTSNYNSILPKPCDDNKASVYQTSDQSGTPEGNNGSTPWKSYVVGGASGGGGGNYTGSGSSTLGFPPCVCPNP